VALFYKIVYQSNQQISHEQFAKLELNLEGKLQSAGVYFLNAGFEGKVYRTKFIVTK
jgi:hypothetical protein